MRIEWPETHHNRLTGKKLQYEVPPGIQIIAEAIGFDLTAKLLLEFGGSNVATPALRVTGESRLVSVIGEEAALSLGAAVAGSHIKVPVGNRFLACYFRSQGADIAEIARKIRTTEDTVRKLLRLSGAPGREALEAFADRFENTARAYRKRARKVLK